MCLIAIAWQARRDLPLMVAANRDEWRERPTKAALPFFLLLNAAVLIITTFPQIVLYLPKLAFPD